MIHIRNGPDFEFKMLDETGEEKGNWFENLAGRKPSFSRDMREIISVRKKSAKYPPTFLATALYGAVKKKLKVEGVSARELYLLSAISSMADRYWETDCFFYLKAFGTEAVVGLDLFYLHEKIFKSLKEFWIDCSDLEVYTQEALHTDLLRYSRIITEIMKGELDIGVRMEDLPEIVKFQSFRKLWLSNYIPQEAILERDPERGEKGFQNQLVVTPSQIVNSFQRKVLAGHIAELLVKQLVSRQLAFAS